MIFTLKQLKAAQAEMIAKYQGEHLPQQIIDDALVATTDLIDILSQPKNLIPVVGRIVKHAELENVVTDIPSS